MQNSFMKINLSKLKIINLKKINKIELIEIINLLMRENPSALLASLRTMDIKSFFLKSAKSKKAMIYILKYKKKTIGYALIVKEIKYITELINGSKFLILINLIKKLKFLSLLNIFMSYYKLDLFFLSRSKKKLINENYNLNLLAINKDFQSRGLGSFFLKKIFKSLKSSKYITVETISDMAYDFYKKKHDFKFLGKKIRGLKNLKILYKKIN